MSKIKMIKTKASVALFILLLITNYSLLFSQVVNQPLNSDIYPFLSRLSQRGVIVLHDEIRPLSRMYIAEKLSELRVKSDELTILAREELEFYIQDFGRETSRKPQSHKDASVGMPSAKEIEKKQPDNAFIQPLNQVNYSRLNAHANKKTTLFGSDSYGRLRLFSYEDSLFAINLSPILGYSIGKNDGEKQTHLWNGFSVYGYLTDYIGFSFDFRDNSETGTNIDKAKEFTPATGITKTESTNTSVAYGRFRGMIGTDWSWGSFSIGKDFINWGYGEGGLLTLSSKAPSFPYYRLDLYPTNWISFNYFHAWLESNVIDSSGIYPTYRDGINRIQHRSKFLASHTLTLRPFNGLSFSLGESVVYSDKLEFLYLFPLSFFRAADHYYSNQSNHAGSNSQFFFSLSSRNHIPNTHLFATLLIDEIALSDIGDPARERSQFGFVFGGSVTDLPVDNLTFAVNYTKIYPFVYRHYIPTQPYDNKGYVLGHWMQHNTDQIYLSLKYRIIRGLQIKAWSEFIRKGGDGIVDDQYTRPSQPFLFGLRKNYTNWGFNVKYEIVHEAFVSLDFKSFFCSEEKEESGAFIDTRRNEFFMSVNYGF
jgi:hypothetical protein